MIAATPEALSSAPLCGLAGAVRIERAERAAAQVVVVRTDDDHLIAQHRIGTRKEADHVAAHAAGRATFWAAPPSTLNSWNQPPAGACEPDLLEPLLDVRRGGVGIGGAGHAGPRGGHPTGT